MASNSPPSADSDGTYTNKDSLLSTSAGGATLLIALQIGSRALTFIVNQILLRYLSPELLGISTQLEVYSISVLFFARESLRVAIQRQADISDSPSTSAQEIENRKDAKTPVDHVDASTAAGRTQAIVNLSYVSISLGLVFAVFFGALYYQGLGSKDPAVLQTPYFGQALKTYGFAAILELLSEPCFVVVQQKSRFKIRAAAESVGTLLRCLVTCSSAIWAARHGQDLGVLPLALGQGVYAFSLTAVYYWSVYPIASSGHYSLFLASIYSSDPKAFYRTYFSSPLLWLSISLFAQGILKHFLTQGDTLVITMLASTTAQGVYALANNYGGLVARLILQPIEESSRNYFGKLLSSSNGTPSKPVVEKARDNLQTLLRAYVLLSVCILAVGPTIAPLLLKIVAGSRWTNSGAGNVLAIYCYYIPLLAINGLTEAFVSSVASEKEVNAQSVWMILFTFCFGGAAYFFLRVMSMGAEGLVWANVLNMGLRILWSGVFVRRWLTRKGEAELGVRALIPKPLTLAAGVGTAAVVRDLEGRFTGGLFDFLKTGAVAGVLLVIIIASERQFLLSCYNSFRGIST